MTTINQSPADTANARMKKYPAKTCQDALPSVPIHLEKRFLLKNAMSSVAALLMKFAIMSTQLGEERPVQNACANLPEIQSALQSNVTKTSNVIARGRS
jgi:hypothetical protein